MATLDGNHEHPTRRDQIRGSHCEWAGQDYDRSPEPSHLGGETVLEEAVRRFRENLSPGIESG
jgi:hypothetical protein